MTREGRRYTVHQALGQGGFGTVYRAELMGEGGFRKTVALKVLNPDMEDVDEIAQRFRDEARVLGLVRHRSIVQVDGLVRLTTAADGVARWAVVMELIEGCHLGELAEAGGVPTGAVLEIVGEVAAALHAAYHKEGPDNQPLRLLHRDIKPPNIQVTAQGEVKVLDFGVARADFAGREAKTQELVFGTAEYMSPERVGLAMGLPECTEGPEGDVYALGVVLYEVVAGQKFKGHIIDPAKHQERVDKAKARLAEVLPTPCPGLVDLVGRMLAHDPAARPSAREVQRACVDLVGELGQVRLMDWAETVVPATRARRAELAAGGLSGATLVEQITTVAGPPSATRPVAETGGSSGGAKVALMGGAAALVIGGLLVVIALGAGGAWWYLSRGPDGGETTSGGPSAQQSASYAASGGAKSVVLQWGDQRYPPGEVPAGRYEIMATFADGREIRVGEIDLAPGEHRKVHCIGELMRCVVK